MTPTPYLLRTEPFFRDYLWGGRKLESALGKPIPQDGVWAESWEMIDHPEHQSRVTNGEFAGNTLAEIAARNPQWIFGDGTELQALPLLFKYLDCQRVLSVQVHPDDEYARRLNPPDLGKTEAWYIVAAEPGAKLYAGLVPGVTPDQLRQAIVHGSLETCLHEIEPTAGDCVFIPAGTVHALGAGLLVAEIQQASNTTFRLFDWNRVGTDGNPRVLHVEQALEVIDFETGPRSIVKPLPTAQPGRERLVDCEKFVLDRLTNSSDALLGGDGKFHLLSAPYGGVELSWENQNPGSPTKHLETLDVGQTALLPAAMPEARASLAAPAVLLDMYLP